MKKTLFILAIALFGTGVLSAQHMKGFVSAGSTENGVDVSFGMPAVGYGTTTAGDNTVTLEMPFSQLVEVVIDTTVLGGTYYNDGYFEFNPVITARDSGTHTLYVPVGDPKNKDPRNLDVLATLILHVLPCGPGEDVTDTVDNTIVYETVPVAGYCWTKQNLRTPSDSASSYNDEAANGVTYGLLYPWYDAVKVKPDGTQEPTADADGYVRGICPPGWHLPTLEEFAALSTVKTQDLRDTTLWIDPRASENTNSSEFTALPAGKYNSSLSRYEGLGTETSFWSTTFYKTGSVITSAKVFVCAWYCEGVLESILPIKDKVSVRCVKKF
jgi:uncharacterized protein (TIGR02145 family)